MHLDGLRRALVWALSAYCFVRVLELLAGCEGPARCPVEPEQLAMHAAAYAWRARGLPTDGCDLARVRVQWASSAEAFRDRCAAGVGGYSCYARDTVDGEYGAPLITIAPGVELDAEGRPLVHETLHYLQDCALGVTDVAHVDPRVWEQWGGAEADAHRFMREVGR